MNDIMFDDDMALNGYIDGALSEAEQVEISVRINNDPAFAAKLEALQRNDALIKAAYQQPMSGPIPVDLLKGLKNVNSVRPAVRHPRSTAHYSSGHTATCWLLPKSVAKPIARLYQKYSR